MRFKRNARANLRAQTSQGVFGNLPPNPDLHALSQSMGKRALVEQMAGTTDRSSKAYKNARDNLGRYLRGTRSPNPASQQKIQKAARTDHVEQLRTRGSLRVKYTADVRKSKRLWKNGNITADLTGGELQDYLDAIEAGDEAGALAIVMDAYGLPADEVASIDNIHGMDLG